MLKKILVCSVIREMTVIVLFTYLCLKDKIGLCSINFHIHATTCYTSPCCCSFDLYDDATIDWYHFSPKLIAIFARLKKIQKANRIARMRNSVISLDKENSSDVIIVNNLRFVSA